MILWTVQDAHVADRLEAGETYVTDESHLIFPECEDTHDDHCNHAYRWLADQMRKRVGEPPAGVRYPVWAWYKRRGQPDGKPDMRSWKAEPSSSEVARIRLDVPDWEVLLSDFDDWHGVLNYWPVFRTKDAYDDYERRLEEQGVDWLDIANWNVRSDALDGFRAEVERSWDLVLDVRRDLDDFCGTPWQNRCIQATFWQIRPENVISVERFAARH